MIITDNLKTKRNDAMLPKDIVELMNMNDHPEQPIGGSFAPLMDTLAEARERQRMADMQRRADAPYNLIAEAQRQSDMQQSGIFGCTQPLNTDLEDALYPERKAQRIQAEMESRMAHWKGKAKSLSDRELLEEVFVMLKTKIFL